jgi:hypothetical protein
MSFGRRTVCVIYTITRFRYCLTVLLRDFMIEFPKRPEVKCRANWFYTTSRDKGLETVSGEQKSCTCGVQKEFIDTLWTMFSGVQ